MTVSFRCFDLLTPLLAIVMSALLSQQAYCQQRVWSLPQYKEAVRITSVGWGNSFVRDTYLSQSRYDGWLLDFEFDSWKGLRTDRLFNTGRFHSSLFFSPLPMTNRLGGGKTFQLGTTAYYAGLWHAVECSMCDLLIGPAAMFDIDALYYVQNSNNPINGEGYLAAGICVDNTFRCRIRSYPIALQATFCMALAGIGIAPDYDMSYWFVYRYGEYGKVLHFISPFNNVALSHQVALLLPVSNGRLKVGYSFDFMENRLGGHYTRLYNGSFTLGYAVKFQIREWSRSREI